MDCLLGQNDRQMCPVSYGNGGGRIRGDFPLAGRDFGYLCGVGSPTRLELNLHLPFEHAPGERIDVDERGVSGYVLNARRIPIAALPEDAETLRSWGLQPDFYFRRCRNYQVAFWRYGTEQARLAGVVAADGEAFRGLGQSQLF